jgi:hypothetical protein
MIEIKQYHVPTLGVDCVCYRCKGRGGYTYNKSVRNRQLKVAKDTGTQAPPIEYDPCPICGGAGIIPCVDASRKREE